MRSMLSVDEADADDLHELIDAIGEWVRDDLDIPLSLLLECEYYGIDINKLISELEKELDYGESDFDDTYWGC
jgi:hypothetical protein